MAVTEYKHSNCYIFKEFISYHCCDFVLHSVDKA
jgi:hypothetical protein